MSLYHSSNGRWISVRRCCRQTRRQFRRLTAVVNHAIVAAMTTAVSSTAIVVVIVVRACAACFAVNKSIRHVCVKVMCVRNCRTQFVFKILTFKTYQRQKPATRPRQKGHFPLIILRPVAVVYTRVTGGFTVRRHRRQKQCRVFFWRFLAAITFRLICGDLNNVRVDKESN